MRQIVLVLLLTLFAAASTDQLERAYAKEYAFLKAQKEMLKKQLQRIKEQESARIQRAKREIEKLQQKVIANDLKIQKMEDELYKLQQNAENVESDTQLVESVLAQGSSLLHQYGKELKVDKNDYPKTLRTLFDTTLELAQKLSKVRKEKGAFYLKDGSEVKGTIVKVGNIASYGISGSVAGALAPAGGGKFKLWESKRSGETARALANGQLPELLHIFIYENDKKEVEDQEEKTILDIINSGGIIGWVIVALGIFGLLLVVLRIFFLASASTKTMELAQESVKILKSQGKEAALDYLKKHKGAGSRVLRAVVRNIEKDREHIEDIIMEALIHESERLDKYGTAIMVIAAVSPLLGLLGTVTGMIDTFDIITEYGTGDPKLLSGGISIALVTTELGLIVAIPLLLLGNLLNGWAEKIKDEIEAAALHLVNEYSK